jgi:hypothetical protein
MVGTFVLGVQPCSRTKSIRFSCSLITMLHQHGSWLILPCRKLNWRRCTGSFVRHKRRWNRSLSSLRFIYVSQNSTTVLHPSPFFFTTFFKHGHRPQAEDYSSTWVTWRWCCYINVGNQIYLLSQTLPSICIYVNPITFALWLSK